MARAQNHSFPSNEAIEPWLVRPGKPFALREVDPRSTPHAPGNEHETDAASAKLRTRLSELQGRLRAEEKQSVLLVLQALDAGGKDGTVKNVFLGANPLGVEVHAFGVPTEHELAHDFLWRIHARVPPRGHIGIFNRSHYEDVLVVRVKNLVDEKVWRARYDQITAFEANLRAGGTLPIKVMLHISLDEQKERLQARIDDPTKQWKFRMGDLDDRKLWKDYQKAYDDALERTSTAEAPWFCVPADKKWYRDWAVLTILVAALEHLDPQYPKRPELAGVVVE